MTPDTKPLFSGYFHLFVPWGLSLLFQDHAIPSYLLAWLGSFCIFYLSLSGRIKPLPADLPFSAQLMRPLILGQLIFAGYMCCTSIFYFLGLLNDGQFFSPPGLSPDEEEQLRLTAQCQRYYCLAHAAFTSGLLCFMRHSSVPAYSCWYRNLGQLSWHIMLFSCACAYLLRFSDGLSQFSHQLRALSIIAGTLALVLAKKERQAWRLCFCLAIYGFNFYDALLSGFKEPVIISVLTLGVFLYPDHPKTVCYSFVPLLFGLFLLLPTYNRIFREQAWTDGIPATAAGQLAFYATLNAESNNNGDFFAYRLSEINMFSRYVQSTPAHTDYYGFDLVQQALTALIPRILWPTKPDTEQLVMARVYRAGVVHPESKVSAKPAFVVDAYLSGGVPGIVICLFCYGAAAQLISNKAEQLFGGYMPGTALIFTGLFQVFWRGQCFEFLINSVCWSYLTMYLIFWMLRFSNAGISAKAEISNDQSHHIRRKPLNRYQ